MLPKKQNYINIKDKGLQQKQHQQDQQQQQELQPNKY